jgi:PAS domain S-box-containing protein
MFGFSPGKFGATYEAFLDCVHPEDRQFVIDSINACVDDGKDYDIEHRIIWPDGTIRTVSEIGNVFRDEDGKAIRMLGIVQDITERKQAEVTHRENEEKYRTTFNMSPDLFYRVSPEGEILECNDTAVETLGYSRDELIGMKLMDIYADESKSRAKEFLKEWKKEGKLRNKELKIVTKAGKEMTISLNVNTLYDSKGNVISSISSQRILSVPKKV